PRSPWYFQTLSTRMLRGLNARCERQMISIIGIGLDITAAKMVNAERSEERFFWRLSRKSE
ncbi:hypothetical protein, partial [Pseudoalteromonas sp. GABNS16H]|uniref:hypothetical protein n=1 Tax=Pseudoalteromonas sp. GABNS16H TaxID=3025325 RepID=UPI00235E53FE